MLIVALQTNKEAEAAQANQDGFECSSYTWQVRQFNCTSFSGPNVKLQLRPLSRLQKGSRQYQNDDVEWFKKAYSLD